MLGHHLYRSFDQRVEAQAPISADLLAAMTSAPLVLVDEFRTAWFAAAEALRARGLLLIFDDFVVGPPEPLLLEAAHHVRQVRRAEHLGHFDHEEEQWYADHPDTDEMYEPPTVSERVSRERAGGYQAARLTPGAGVVRLLAGSLRVDRKRVLDLVRLELALERLLVELAGAIRIGDAAVVDARLAGERADAWRWAA